MYYIYVQKTTLYMYVTNIFLTLFDDTIVRFFFPVAAAVYLCIGICLLREPIYLPYAHTRVIYTGERNMSTRMYGMIY